MREALRDHWPEYLIEAAGLGVFNGLGPAAERQRSAGSDVTLAHGFGYPGKIGPADEITVSEKEATQDRGMAG